MITTADIEKLREMVRRSDFSHVSYRSWCGADLIHVYRREPASPSHCELVWGCYDTPEVRAVIADEGKLQPQAGGQMGNGGERR